MQRRSRAGRSFDGAAARWLLAIAFSVSCLALPGCGGCRNNAAQNQTEEEKAAEERKKQQEKPKPPLQAQRLQTRPAAPSRQDRRAMPERFCKPGHWTAVTLTEAKANHDDYRGTLETWTVDKKLAPTPLEGQPYELTIARGATLPKGQLRSFETALFVPPGQSQPSAMWRLSPQRGSRGELEGNLLLTLMPSYQYHLVVLARLPTSYAYLDSMRSVRRGASSATANPFYRVHLLNVANARERLLLPSHAMFWTSTAYVLWDDADPLWLDAEQRQALVDWLHWGGQLILSGPETLDTLRDSFLADYLPAESAGSVELDAKALTPLERFNAGGRALLLSKPLSGVRLKLRDGRHGRFVPDCGELLVEGRVGRGRVVVSAFRLRGRDLTEWPGWDSFFNACLLGRPARQYREEDGVWIAHWLGKNNEEPLDAGLITGVRYFVRDAGNAMDRYGADVHQQSGIDASLEVVYSPGPAAWNDFSPVANEARRALGTASRIKIPEGRFVLAIVGAYLVVLVPLNWLVFRLIGRVEWAWAAAPVVAVICTAVVIRAAQLDIGFVRARTEVGVLELQGDYPRAHLTRYAALYTSLTTSYRFELEEAGAVVQPLAPSKDESRGYSSSPTSLRLQRGESVEMSGLSVDSSSLRYVHGEQMIDLAGPLELVHNNDGGLELVNRTGLRLRGAGLMRRDEDSTKTAWLGSLEPGSTTRVVFSWDAPAAEGSPFGRQRAETPLTASGAEAGELSVRGLVELAEDHTAMGPGEVRVVAWLDDELPGMTIRPASPQSRFATVVVANLRYGFDRDPQPDPVIDPDRTKKDPNEKSTAALE